MVQVQCLFIPGCMAVYPGVFVSTGGSRCYSILSRVKALGQDTMGLQSCASDALDLPGRPDVRKYSTA